MKDLADAKPTIYIGVPRLYNLFYDKIQAMLKAMSDKERLYAEKAIQEKMTNLR